MNERIKELWAKCVLDNTKTPMNFQDVANQFAELILAEVDDVIDNLYHALPLEQAAVLLTLDENIKERFYGDK